MPPSTRSTVSLAARPVGAHRLEQIAGLVADRFERGAGEFGAPALRVRPIDRAARIGIPVRRAEPDEGRHQIDLLGRVGRARQRVRVGGALDQLQPVAQPLHGGAGDEDRAFQRIGALAVELIGDGGQQPVAARRPALRRC